MSKVEKTGGCQCGKVRYTAQVDPAEAYLCHCKMCQRATGGVFAAFVQVKQADVAWDREPDWFESSPIAKRPFCSACGSPLGFQFAEGSANMDLTIGSFDERDDFTPMHHFGAESLHEAWIDTSGLPRIRTQDYQALREKWIRATGKVPE